MYEALNLLKNRLHAVDNELVVCRRDVDEYEHALMRAKANVAELQAKYDDLESAIELIEKAM